MDSPKTTSKRVANLTIYERTVLTRLIKRYPQVQSKLRDKLSANKKKEVWNLIAAKFNSYPNVHKRDIITLRKAWNIMKNCTRKAGASKHCNERTGGSSPLSPIDGTTNVVEEDAPVVINEIKNSFDSDGIILNTAVKSQDSDSIDADIKDNLETSLSVTEQKYRLELQMLRIKKRSAKFEEEINKTLLEKAKIELEGIKTKMTEDKNFNNENRDDIDDFRIQLRLEELQYKRKLYEYQLQSVAKEVEIKNETLNQLRDGRLNWQNFFNTS
ncbi:uncharacterized protein LOC113517179 [Galleria mellonella]|uniref:Regulatory protein zeste n=1 Tax=Galleria mellonella TaxID=7137 RepID=A0ABM3MQW8_GALME|nr:uncharacterized protein LOC113517179 [Galleria mellonella]